VTELHWRLNILGPQQNFSRFRFN